jgi:carbamoyl-phosphate synthase large subunit
MNILITSAGRQCYLVYSFQAALRGRGRVAACDVDAHAPALRQADTAFVVPPIDREAYIDVLLGICKQHRIRLLIPAREPELLLLARHRARFLEVGTLPLVSDLRVVSTCCDKWEASKFLAGLGIASPLTYLSLAEAREALSRGEISFPLVVKHRWGCGSLGLEYPEDDEELGIVHHLARKRHARMIPEGASEDDPGRCIVIQERLRGHEYGLDIVNNLECNYITTLVKRKLRMLRSGSTDRAVTVRDERLERLGEAIGLSLGHIGVLDCDLIVAEDGSFVLDLNPRFGGGYPFSHSAGSNIPAALIAWANGEEANPAWLTVSENITASQLDWYWPSSAPCDQGRLPLNDVFCPAGYEDRGTAREPVA